MLKSTILELAHSVHRDVQLDLESFVFPINTNRETFLFWSRREYTLSRNCGRVLVIWFLEDSEPVSVRE
jgi:hypothetical protein